MCRIIIPAKAGVASHLALVIPAFANDDLRLFSAVLLQSQRFRAPAMTERFVLKIETKATTTISDTEKAEAVESDSSRRRVAR